MMSREAVRGLGLLGILSAVVVVYWSSFATIAQMWQLSTYRHGWLILAISGFLLWRDRLSWWSVTWRGSSVGFIALIGSVALWVVARETLVQAAEHFSVVAIVNASVLAVGGWALYRKAAFPLLYLLFMLPIGAGLVPHLMEITADISAFSLTRLGVPVFREGMLMVLPGGNFEVADVCSGLRFLNAGLALGTLIAYTMFRSSWRRLTYIAVVASVLLLANGLRATLVMAVASATEMRYLAGDDHIWLGWILFLGAVIALYVLAERYSDRTPSYG